MSNQYEYFDRVMATRNPDFLFISHQMSAIAHTMVSADSELLWRLSQATFGITFNMDWFRDQAGIKTKTQEAKTFAERAIKANPESFGAHLWMAKCIGQIILVEKSKLAALSHLGQMRFHLSQASTMQPTNWRVLLLEAQVQVGLYEHLKELKAGGMDINGVVEPLPLVEQKLANCLSQNPMSHEAFFAQTCVLFMQHKFNEAYQCANAALSLERLNKGEEFVAAQIEEWLPTLAQKAGANTGEKQQAM